MYSYHLKYRPSHLGAVLGQDHVTKSIEALFKEGKVPHSMCFSGPSGTGKTTLARIVASELKCDPVNVIEIDAATHTGIDAMRELAEGLRYSGMGHNPLKFVILDEAHMLTKSSFNSLLKIIEEPPNHCYFALCTTELSKIPTTIQTRCHCYNLKEVSFDDLMDLMEYVVKEEEIECPKGALEVIATECQGSPRRALVYLSQISGCKTKEEVLEVIESAQGSAEVIDICRLLAKGQGVTWKNVIGLLKKLDKVDPESVRLVIFNYFSSVVLNSKSEPFRALQVLGTFSQPITNRSSGMGELLLMFADIIFEKE